MNDEKHGIQETLKHLQERHRELEYDIAWGYSTFLNDNDMNKLKKEKLLVKDRIEKLTQTVNER